MLTLNKFEEASEKVKEVTLETKLIYSEFLSELTGNKVYLKPENMQFTGAYKVRGAYYKLSTLSDEDNCSLLARLATQWSYVKDLYRIQQKYFSQHDGVDVNTMIRSFVNNFVKYKSEYDRITSSLGRSSSETGKILSAFKCRYEYSHGIEPSEKSMLAENFDIDHIGEKFVGVLKQCEILLEYQKIIEGPYSALAEFIKSVRCRIDSDKILFIKEIPEIKNGNYANLTWRRIKQTQAKIGIIMKNNSCLY